MLAYRAALAPILPPVSGPTRQPRRDATVEATMPVIGLRAPSGDDTTRCPTTNAPRPALARPALPRAAAIAVLSLLAGCGGTVLEMEGQICNQPVKLRMADSKDRSAFDLGVTCGPGGGVTVTTAESSASRVMEAQAEALTRLAGELAREAAAGVLP